MEIVFWFKPISLVTCNSRTCAISDFWLGLANLLFSDFSSPTWNRRMYTCGRAWCWLSPSSAIAPWLLWWPTSFCTPASWRGWGHAASSTQPSTERSASQRYIDATAVSQITGNSTIWSTAWLTLQYRKFQRSALPTLCEENPLVTGGFPSHKASTCRRRFQYIIILPQLTHCLVMKTSLRQTRTHLFLLNDNFWCNQWQNSIFSL